MPRLRRLRRAQGRAGLPARPRAAPREHRLRLRHRLLQPLPLLPRHLRHALDPRPRAGDRDRHRHRARGPVGVGRHRRRRRAVDRRQPPDPRAAPQRQHDDPAVQQPDLRPDQGPVLPHQRAGQDHQVHARWARSTTRSTRSRWRSAPRPRSWPAPSTPTASTSPRCWPAAAAHRGTSFVEIYQNCPIFNDGAFDAIKDRDSKEDAIIPLVHGEPIRFGVGGTKGLVRDAGTGGVKVVEVGDAARAGDRGRPARPRRPRAGPHDRVRDLAAHRRRLPPPGADRRSSARSSARRTTTRRARRSSPPRAGVEGDPQARLGALISGGDTWTVA